MYILSRMGGLLGRLIAKRLTHLGQRVSVLGADDVDLRAWAPDVEASPIPLDAARAVESSLTYARGLLLLPEGPDERPLHDEHIIEQAVRAGVPRVVRVSIHGAEPDSADPLLAHHGRGDRALEESGLPHTILRPHLFMQDLLLFAPSIRAGHALRAPGHGGRVGFVDIRDVADATVRLIQRPLHQGDVFELTGPRTWTLTEAALAIGEAIHRTVTVEHWPDYPEALQGIGLSSPRARSVAHILSTYGPDEQATRTVSRITGLPPRALEMFLLDHRKHFTGKEERQILLADQDVVALDHALTW